MVSRTDLVQIAAQGLGLGWANDALSSLSVPRIFPGHGSRVAVFSGVRIGLLDRFEDDELGGIDVGFIMVGVTLSGAKYIPAESAKICTTAAPCLGLSKNLYGRKRNHFSRFFAKCSLRNMW